MKKILLASVALAVLAAPAMAADLKAPVYKAPPPVYVFSWTGCYVGGNIGGVSVHKEWIDRTPGDPLIGLSYGSHQADSWIGGLQAGCNYQFAGGWVIGIEGDGSATQSDGQQVETLFPAFRIQTTEHWMATARGKLGYAWDKWLFYVTGGGAWAELQTNNWNAVFVPAGAGLAAIQKNTVNGWTVGVGAEYALGYGWSIKGEYQYMEFGTSTFFTPTNPIALAEFNVKLRQSAVKFGMNYKFDWGGPVVAKY